MADGTLLRYRALALVLIAGNLGGLFLLRTLGGATGVDGGVVFREPGTATKVLVAASLAASLGITVVVASCFVSFFRGAIRNRFVGDDYEPAWADAALVLVLVATCGLLVLAAR